MVRARDDKKNMSNTYKNVLVTGGSGFVGSHLVDTLVDMADKVIVIDKVRPEKNRKNPKAKYIKMNVQDSDVLDVFEEFEPDVVFHLAAHLHDRESVEMPVGNAMDNVIGFLHVCEANRKTSKAKIIFTSSCAVYGAQKQVMMSESMIPMPLTPYGISKLVGEHYLQFYHNMYGIPYVAVRPGNIYGPRQDSSAESGVIGIFSSRLLSGKPATINNDGETTRDYVYVSDIVDALLRAAESEFVGSVNLGTGVQTSTQEVFEKVKTAVGGAAVPDRNEQQQDALKHIALDITLAHEMLGWEPQVMFDDGVKKTVEWYRENS